MYRVVQWPVRKHKTTSAFGCKTVYIYVVAEVFSNTRFLLDWAKILETFVKSGKIKASLVKSRPYVKESLSQHQTFTWSWAPKLHTLETKNKYLKFHITKCVCLAFKEALEDEEMMLHANTLPHTPPCSCNGKQTYTLLFHFTKP